MAIENNGRIAAILGPTNTGKTHFALERLLAHRSGMIGFPLRLLARENYDRALRIKGQDRVALVTGEEKIIPAHAQYYFCTVESMPVDLPLAFVAVDEIQMAADPERGHIFTDRLLHARGEEETLFMGAETIRPILRRLLPEIDIISRPRLSTLVYTGPRKVTRLPRRSAVVAFSIAEVYRLAELIRQQQGGAAVVMGALSPRTRNAQVDLFQAGEVDYLVATDAIGMGLNLDVDHVAFAGLSKFDGRAPRRLAKAELAQIAGRAGRHLNDGTFGTTDNLGSFEPEIVTAIENHQFDPIQVLQWRNNKLDFSSPAALLASLDRRPDRPNLIRVREADDRRALAVLLADRNIAELAKVSARLQLLWDVAQVPDFGKIATEMHSRFLGQVFQYLCAGLLPEDWVASQIDRVARTNGDIDTLMQRIAQIRIWTYIAHRPDWLHRAAYWQTYAREAEDRLSDALHAGLSQRFIDRRQAVLVRRLAKNDDIIGAVRRDGVVVVEGHPVGKVAGLSFTPDTTGALEQQRVILSAARRALASEWPHRVDALLKADQSQFMLDQGGMIQWNNVPVAQIRAGATIMSPVLKLIADEDVPVILRQRAQEKIQQWLNQHIDNILSPLTALAAADLSGAARGVSFRLYESLGLMPAGALAGDLSKAQRQSLQELGVRFGWHSVWLTALDKPMARKVLSLLCAIHEGGVLPSALFHQGRHRLFPDVGPELPMAQRNALGLRSIAGYLLAPHLLEKISAVARAKSAQGPFALTQDMLNLFHNDDKAATAILKAIGYHQEISQGVVIFRHRRKIKKRRRAVLSVRANADKSSRDPHSPFAVLSQIRLKSG